MALRTIRTIGDELLYQKSREVKKMTPRTQTLIGDMLETMYDAQGVGLAAPQVVSVSAGIIIVTYSVVETVHQRKFADRLREYLIEKNKPIIE